ncbi:unnamed protein product [Brassica rapa subsp. narinosa]|nr:unnamed protein product [Brassica napus]
MMIITLFFFDKMMYTHSYGMLFLFEYFLLSGGEVIGRVKLI